LNPEDAAEIARRAKAKRLALTHFDAGRYTTIQGRLDAVKSITNFSNVIVGRDDLALEI
jgi:ribonuclease BN (tRNA processing enzyme)